MLRHGARAPAGRPSIDILASALLRRWEMKPKSILIVDDELSIRISLPACLVSDSVSIRTASTLEEAKLLLATEPFDVVITDLRLSGSVGAEGLQLLRWVRGHMPQTLAIVMTAFGSDDVEREARRQGACDYWSKSILIPDIISRLRALGIPAGRADSPPPAC